MDNTDTLFTRAAFEEVKNSELKVEKRERVVVDKIVTVCGEKFNLDDLYETLSSIGRGIYITNRKMATVLKKIGVIETEGCSYSGASKGVNYSEFRDMIRDLYREVD